MGRGGEGNSCNSVSKTGLPRRERNNVTLWGARQEEAMKQDLGLAKNPNVGKEQGLGI